jgi:hypothetical protein
MLQTSRAIRKRRLAFAVPGFIVGTVVIRWLLTGGFAAVEALGISLGMAGWALWFGEKFGGLSTRDDLAVVRLREEMSPLGLRPDSEIPSTLKTEIEKRLTI